MREKRKILEVCEEIGVTYEYVVHFVEEEWVHPAEQDSLDEEDIARIHLIRELIEDFGVNDEGVPIILHLIDQLNYMRLEMKRGPEGPL